MAVGLIRIRSELRNLARNPDPYFRVFADEANMFNIHFSFLGPSETPFAKGIYHGVILLPQEYPLKPPNIRFYTENGRFEVNKNLCLTFTTFHPECWNPTWTIRNIINGIRSILNEETPGSIGSITTPAEHRMMLAERSRTFSCSVCHCSHEQLVTTLKDERPAEESAQAQDNTEKEQDTNPPPEVAKGEGDVFSDVKASIVQATDYMQACLTSVACDTQKECEAIPSSASDEEAFHSSIIGYTQEVTEAAIDTSNNDTFNLSAVSVPGFELPTPTKALDSERARCADTKDSLQSTDTFGTADNSLLLSRKDQTGEQTADTQEKGAESPDESPEMECTLPYDNSSGLHTAGLLCTLMSMGPSEVQGVVSPSGQTISVKVAPQRLASGAVMNLVQTISDRCTIQRNARLPR